MLSTGAALALVFIAFAATSVLHHRDDEHKKLVSLSAIVGANSADALLSRKRGKAEEMLATLDAQPEIVEAVLYDRLGMAFARHLNGSGATTTGEVPPLPAAMLSGPQPGMLTIGQGPWWRPSTRFYRTVEKNGEMLGAVMLQADLGPMWASILKNLGIVAAASACSLGVALLLTGRFKSIIADPISKLIEAAQSVSSSQTYTHRIRHRRTDELGILIDSFNDMLTQIENRDSTLADYRNQLERQVGVRTEQLEKAKNAAEAASHAKSAFLATMSHEIRTPMNGVLGMTELLLASELNEQQRHYTNMVKRSGEHLLVIINDILDFSKIEAGKLSVEYIHFNFRELIEDIDNAFRPQADAKGLGLEFDIANDIPVSIIGDPNRLRQVIVNLLGNAVKFTDVGKITVKVSITGEDSQAVNLRFEVHDTGMGVSHEAQTRIFESFSQADGSTTRKHGGTGLGLSISKQLVELMGGQIGVENARVRGSVFWFAASFDKRRVDFDDPAFNRKATEGLRVLIVDENAVTREVLERQLTSWELGTDTVASATDCLQAMRDALAKGSPYDAVLVDMELPRTSGLALAATIKADPTLAFTRILLLSTERNAADTVQRREAGVACQLIKPARECDLFDCIVTPLRATEAVRPVTQPAVRPASKRKRRRVLVAEDNPVNVEVALAMLESLGLDGVAAQNGEEAVQAVLAEDFDLVLMDCQMPVMDGFAATAEIRRHEHKSGHPRQLPIVAITANALQGDREACLAAGMDDYLSKPFTPDALAQTIARWFSLPRAATVHHEEQALAATALRPQPLPAALPPVSPPSRSAQASPLANGINRHALDNIRALSANGGEALLQRVINAYVNDTPKHLQSLRQAVASTNAANMRKAAHSLKSSSANVGAEALAQMSKTLETLGRADTTDGAAAILANMENEFEAVRNSLSAILEKEI
jgi:signal transduction histidine kinase/DNA-binding response OmpR family regulator/HPt (histidine-containing phosphotransfer) domain-containing protein